MRLLKKFVRKLYHLIWFLSLFTLFLIPKVNAAVNGNAIFVGQQVDTTWTIASNGSKNGNTWFSSNSDFTGNFIYADVCTTGYEPTIWITSDIEGKAISSSRWYKVDVPCYASGYKADVYRQIIYVTSVQYEKATSSSDYDYFSLQFGSRLFSNTDYTTYMRLLHLGMSDNIPLDDLMFDQNTTEISILKDILAELRANPNVDQQILQSNQAILQQEQQANQKLDSIDDTLNDSSVDSSDNSLNNLKDQLPTNSVISDLLLLPVRLLQSIVNSIGGTCSSFNLGSLYGTNLVMPCINLQNYLGSAIWTFVDLVFSGMFVLVIRKKFIQIWENITNLRGGGNEVD